MNRYIAGVLAQIGLIGLVAGPAGAGEPVKVGAVLPFSGVYASIGEEIANAMEMAFEQAGGAVAGRPLMVIRADSEVKPNVALARTRQLVASEGVDLLVGPVASSEALAMRDFVVQSRTPLIMPNAGANILTGEKCSPYLVRVGFSNAQFVRPMGAWLHGQGVRTAFLLAPDYAAGRELMEGFAASFTAAGGEVVASEYTPFQRTTDFGPYLARVKQAAPDALFVFYAGSEAINFVKQAADFRLGDRVRITGPAWTVSPLFLPAQGDAAAGFIGSLNYVPGLDNPANRHFQAAYQAKYGRVASEFGAQGFESGLLIVEALKLTQGRTDDREALIRAIRQVRLIGPRGPIHIDPATNNVVQNIYVVEARRTEGRVELAVLDTIPALRDEPEGCRMDF